VTILGGEEDLPKIIEWETRILFVFPDQVTFDSYTRLYGGQAVIDHEVSWSIGTRSGSYRDSSIWEVGSYTTWKHITCISPNPVPIDAETTHEARLGWLIPIDIQTSLAFDRGCATEPV